MANRAQTRWSFLLSLEPTLKLFVIALVVYLGAIYLFAFAQGEDGARHAVRLAIAMMDAVILAGLFRDGARALYGGGVRAGGRRWLHGLLGVLACASLICVVLLHADFEWGRYTGGEFGIAGKFEEIKAYLLAAQLSYVFFAAWLKWLSAAGGVFPPPRFAAGDFLLFSLLLIPLVNYLAQNRADFALLTAVEYLMFFLLCPVAVFVVIQCFHRLLSAESIAAPVVAGLAFVYYSMPWISGLCKRPVEVLFPVQLFLALIVPALLAVAYRLAKRPTIKGVVAAAVFSVTASFVQAIVVQNTGDKPPSAADSPPGTNSEESALTKLLSAPVKKRPDVYLLIYDGYAPSAMLKYYGLESASAEGYLRSRGFTIYDDAYSLFLASKTSMTSLLDMREKPRAAIGRDNRTNEFFRRQGYKTYLVLNSYMLQGSDRITADSVFPPWRYRSGLSALYRGIGGGEFKTEVVFDDSPREEWLAAKRAVFAPAPHPKMLYAHSGFPSHTQNSGRCREDETARYAKRLGVANDEIKTDVEMILQSRRDAIIIVAADHGPHMTGDCLYMNRSKPADLSAMHIADRYGTLLAIRWPGPAPKNPGRNMVIQNVFFAVAAYLLEDDRVWSQRLKAGTTGFGGIPNGAVRDGIVMVGKDKGRRLFEQ